MIDYKSASGSLNPINFFKILKFRREFAKEHPLYFDYDGLTIFVGPQGSGKTLSAVRYVRQLLNYYPHCKLCTNIFIKDFPIVNFNDYIGENKERFTNENGEFDESSCYNSYLEENRVFEFVNQDDLSRYNNGEKGFIFLIDEIQLYFNSLQSKNINPEVMVQISQQRKQRKHIVCTSQVFGRMAKPLREQFSSVIVCKNYLKCLQVNKLIDRDTVEEYDNSTTMSGTVKKKFIWFHSPKDYDSYDTYYIIENNKFIPNEEKKEVGLYDYRLYNNCKNDM